MPAWKIIETDNFDREGPGYDEKVVAENIANERDAICMCDGLRRTCTEDGPYWYKVEPQNYKPRKFEPWATLAYTV